MGFTIHLVNEGTQYPRCSTSVTIGETGGDWAKSGGEIETGVEWDENEWGLCGGQNEGIEKVSRHSGRSKRVVNGVKGVGMCSTILSTT